MGIVAETVSAGVLALGVLIAIVRDGGPHHRSNRRASTGSSPRSLFPGTSRASQRPRETTYGPPLRTHDPTYGPPLRTHDPTYRTTEERVRFEPTWKNFENDPKAVIGAFARAHPGDEPKNFKAFFGAEKGFDMEVTDRPFKTGRKETLTKTDSRYPKSWMQTINEAGIEKKGVVVIDSKNGTKMVVPKGGKFKDMFQYLKDDDVAGNEKALFLKTIFEEAQRVGEGALVATDGRDIDWLHVRLTGAKSGGSGSGIAMTSLLGAAVAGALAGASS